MLAPCILLATGYLLGVLWCLKLQALHYRMLKSEFTFWNLVFALIPFAFVAVSIALLGKITEDQGLPRYVQNLLTPK